MKAETINYFVPQSIRFTGAQMREIRDRWCEQWGEKKDDFESKATEEDILEIASGKGWVELPEGWKA